MRIHLVLHLCISMRISSFGSYVQIESAQTKSENLLVMYTHTHTQKRHEKKVKIIVKCNSELREALLNRETRLFFYFRNPS